MRHLIAKHKGVEFEAGDRIVFYNRRTGKEVEGIVAALDDGAIAEAELELFVVCKEDIFGDHCLLEINEWEKEEKELLKEYANWYWDWADIAGSIRVSSSILRDILNELQKEVK